MYFNQKTYVFYFKYICFLKIDSQSELTDNINNRTILLSVKCKKISDTAYVCNMGKDNTWWQLIITVGSNNAEINYGIW